jgi:dCMP deaminase
MERYILSFTGQFIYCLGGRVFVIYPSKNTKKNLDGERLGVKYDKMHMATAEAYANESHCPRTHVGCALVLASGVVSGGFNGHASGGPNEWEFSPDGNPEVVHAELNSLGKCLEQGLSTKGATMYVTLSPCLECSKLLVRAGIRRVVYRDEYRLTTGIDYLRKYNVEVEKL